MKVLIRGVEGQQQPVPDQVEIRRISRCRPAKPAFRLT